MGYRAPSVMLDLINGKAVEPIIYTGLDECTQDNAANCIGG
jgi:ribose transport system substrate-binding protein